MFKGFILLVLKCQPSLKNIINMITYKLFGWSGGDMLYTLPIFKTMHGGG
jgi:hypothetical protein